MINGIFKTLRPKQWTKNSFILAALIFDLKLFQPEPLIATLLGFILFCFISGTVYLINDLVDIDRDRQHPTKKYRPLPSGQVPIQAAIIASILLPALCLPLSFWLNFNFGLIATSYLLIQIAYSFVLKNIVIVDLLTLAAGFVLRVAGGVALVEAERFSPWLYVAMVLLALFLGIGKRRTELAHLKEHAVNTRSILNQYNLPFLDEMMAVVTAGTVITYAFYTFTADNLPDNHTMMLTVPFVLYAIFRYLYVIHVQNNISAPDEILLSDRPLQVSIILFGIAVVAILYLS